MEITPDFLRILAEMLERNEACVQHTTYSSNQRDGMSLEVKFLLLAPVNRSGSGDVAKRRPRPFDFANESTVNRDQYTPPYDLERRQKRAIRLIAYDKNRNLIRPFADHYWTVPSTKDDAIRYETSIVAQTCTCLDYEKHKKACKHIIAVEMIVAGAPKAGVELLVKMVKVIVRTWLSSIWDAIERLVGIVKVLVKEWARDVVDCHMVRVSMLELK